MSYDLFYDGDIILFSNKNPVREPPWDTLNMATLDKDYSQILGSAETMTLTRKGPSFILTSAEDDKRPVLLLNSKEK